MALPRPPANPVLDIRVRWRVGQVLLGAAAVLAAGALLRPLAEPRPGWLKVSYALALGLGLTGSALLAALRGSRRPEALALQGFLALAVDGLGQLAAPVGLPVWPLMTLLVASQAVAEGLRVALGFGGLAGLLAAAEAARAQPPDLRQAIGAAIGYLALAFAVDRALCGEKRRLSAALARLARVEHGIGQLDDETEPAPGTGSLEVLRQVIGEGRRGRQHECAGELDQTLQRLVEVARDALAAHAVLYFDLDRQREQALLRAKQGPETLRSECAVPLASDPFSFLVQRDKQFYATDFKRLLWELPWYREQVKVGSLMAAPVRVHGVTAGALVAERLETQSFIASEPRLLAGFAALAAGAIERVRASLNREELDAELKAVHPISQRLATLSKEPEVFAQLLDCAGQVPGTSAAAVVMKDEHDTRYTIELASGWAAEYRTRVVGLDQRTWASWVLRSAQEPTLLDDVASHQRMPFYVLDERASRAEALLAVHLRAGDRTLGALVLTGPRGAFDSSGRRVLSILANQAGATLQLLKDRERHRQQALRDGLTQLYNRRAFDDLLASAIANEDRRGDGRLGLLLLDVDHFKKLNDTHGHPAGDAALHSLARLIDQHRRKGDYAARYGGEEFVMILPGSDQDDATQAAERLRSAVEKHRLLHEGARIPFTASFGVAVWPADGRDPEELVAAADRALYAAKQSGRNRVVAASALPAAGQA